MNNNKFTIIIPLYNKERYISDTIKSVLQQNYKNFELIVVNDGSTDGSLLIASSLQNQNTNFQIHSITNSGVASARNFGISIATGSYVVFLDADDLLDNNFLHIVNSYINKNPYADIYHVSWRRVNDGGRVIDLHNAPSSLDWRRDILLGNMFAPHCLIYSQETIKKNGGYKNGFFAEDWEYIARCIHSGAKLSGINEYLVSYREADMSRRKMPSQQNRFFPEINEIFKNCNSSEYANLKSLSTIRHHFFLLEDYIAWNEGNLAAKNFNYAFKILWTENYWDSIYFKYLIQFSGHFSFCQLFKISLFLFKKRSFKDCLKFIYARLSKSLVINKSILLINNCIDTASGHLSYLSYKKFRVIRKILSRNSYELNQNLGIENIKALTLNYIKSMKMPMIGGIFCGYKHSKSTTKAVLYATLSALLVRHLYGDIASDIDEQLDYVQKFQCDDGLFRDPVINCNAAETEDCWGWTHLTLHAIMVFALYDKKILKKFSLIDIFNSRSDVISYLEKLDWGNRVAWTSNHVQNLMVMMQYSRDYQGLEKYDQILSYFYDYLDQRQSNRTGLFGEAIETKEDLSMAVQAGYHFWCPYFYDERDVLFPEKIINNLLLTQNNLGGFGFNLHSSACEDIDTLDPLFRLRKIIGKSNRDADIDCAFIKAFPAILNNLNTDGGWVFRRHEPLEIYHREMYSRSNESNMFYTWFRTLGLAYCLMGMNSPPSKFVYPWNFKRAPGHQFL
jgi:glycosyltransferase involved in cell wall biosynthesis